MSTFMQIADCTSQACNKVLMFAMPENLLPKSCLLCSCTLQAMAICRGYAPSTTPGAAVTVLPESKKHTQNQMQRCVDV